jgi:hypothetical protein
MIAGLAAKQSRFHDRDLGDPRAVNRRKPEPEVTDHAFVAVG